MQHPIIKNTTIEVRNTLNKIKTLEILGAVICLAAVIAILIGYSTLDTWYLRICGIASSFLLLLLPIISIRTMLNFRSIKSSASNFKHTLAGHHESKTYLMNMQKLSMCLCALLFVVFLPVVGKLYDGKDILKVSATWYAYAIGFPFLYHFAQCVFKQYHKNL